MKPSLANSVVVLLVVAAATPCLGEELVITQDTVLEKDAVLQRSLVIKSDYVTIDGNGATLAGPGVPGKPETFQGVGVLAEGCRGVTLRNLKVKGFASGLVVKGGDRWLIEKCDFSDNYHAPEAGWGNGPRQGGMILTGVRDGIFRDNRANRVWNGLDLDNCSGNLIVRNNFSHCSNVCLKMATATNNRVLDNNLSYGLRIAPGEVHARDSTSVLIESGSDDNEFRGNDITHGGDGIFIRVLNNWVSKNNVFIENDCSYAHNNCVESWSPGNTFIRNKANRGSYGFWLGGSDQTVLVGNEAAYNGLPGEHHNAPEAGFSHGGIVFVGGSSSHSKLIGNYCHHNNGGGIVFRGDVASKGKRWNAFHWIVQGNRLENNRWGIYGLYGDWMLLADNVFRDNAEGNHFEGVTNLIELKAGERGEAAPRAVLDGPSVAKVGQPAHFDASHSTDPRGRPLTYRWDLGGAVSSEVKATRTFAQPGFHRVGLTVSNGRLADLAFRDFLAVEDVADELGTEGGAAQWGSEIEGDAAGKAHLAFRNDPQGIVGRFALRFRPSVYPGMDVTAIYPAKRNAGWDFSNRKQLTFWMKYQNPNTGGFQDAGPVVWLDTSKGRITFRPAGDKNFLREAAASENRWIWQRLTIPLAGGEAWKREIAGTPDLKRIDAIGFAFDSWEGEPFTVWLDGLTCE
ncbi:MAG: right-handed parallel beta-helix repeat-containing protein [Pirellulales bacterium]|nr:right-handed parallel beta-helix repeat-containing protein [Pirellulales bacterium]